MSPLGQGPHRQGPGRPPQTCLPLPPSGPPPAWPRPPPSQAPTLPPLPQPALCVCHRVRKVAQVAPSPPSKEAPAIWVTDRLLKPMGVLHKEEEEKRVRVCWAVWRQSMLTSQLRCTYWLCMSAIPCSNSEEEGEGSPPNSATVCNFCLSPTAVCTVHHDDANDDQLRDQDRKRVLQCCLQIDFLQLPRDPLCPPLPAPSLSKHYEESCNYKESTFTPCQVQIRQRTTKKQFYSLVRPLMYIDGQICHFCSQGFVP